MYPGRYNFAMSYEITSTAVFAKWLRGLKDRTTRNKVLARIDRMQNGNFGDFKLLDSNLFELRFFFGGGLRIYYTIRNHQVVLLLNGGSKSSQRRDIEKAKRMIQELE
ncbi:MAG: type II toxin-antitoxin system RelE/ParE family toxin [Chloroflexota bacterium]